LANDNRTGVDVLVEANHLFDVHHLVSVNELRTGVETTKGDGEVAEVHKPVRCEQPAEIDESREFNTLLADDVISQGPILLPASTKITENSAEIAEKHRHEEDNLQENELEEEELEVDGQKESEEHNQPTVNVDVTHLSSLLAILRQELAACSKSPIRKTNNKVQIHRYVAPYFKDRRLMFPPRNPDSIEMVRMNIIDAAAPPMRGWKLEEANKLQQAVKAAVKKKLLVPLESR
ncbi:unnamed protein product, partial [Soboliphyme baturini]|uniref:DUF4806 domain-containing protein n=1 Tax=Soboliphyme baturini TaxID=241478 RepID=A0A183J3H3_9BILA